MSLDDEIRKKQEILKQQMAEEAHRKKVAEAMKNAFATYHFYDSSPVIINPSPELKNILNETMPKMKFRSPKFLHTMPDGRTMVRETITPPGSQKKESGNTYSMDVLLYTQGQDKSVINVMLWIFNNGTVSFTINGAAAKPEDLNRYGITTALIRDKIIEEIARISITSSSTTTSSSSSGSGGCAGCYIATAVYGSYDCPEVWVLRRYRDRVLRKTALGKLFVKVYYFISPKLVRVFGNKTWFRNIWRSFLDKKVDSLKEKGFSDERYSDDEIC